MHIDPSVWSEARFYAKQFVVEHYKDEAELFDTIATALEKRLVALDWSFEFGEGTSLTGLGLTSGLLDPESSHILILTAALLSVLPKGKRPPPKEIINTVDDIARSQPETFRRKFTTMALNLYKIDALPIGRPAYSVVERYEKITRGGCEHLSLEDGRHLYDQASKSRCEYHIILRFEGAASAKGLVWEPKLKKPRQISLRRLEALFLRVLLEACEPVEYQELAQRVLNASSLSPEKREHLYTIKYRVGRCVGEWLKEKIQEGEIEESYTIDPIVRFCILSRVREQKEHP